ncbi:MAG TPA: hypothetical protein VF173_12745 [Thermoanaerobaculia bacterium]|nr:hypothetical protein [Thermoanaerobaculia bacterium]
MSWKSAASAEADLSPVAGRVLAVLAGLEPEWALSGPAALWRLPGMPSPIHQLDLVWYGRDRLRSLPRVIRRTLAQAGMETIRIRGTRRRAWIGVREGSSGCLLRLSAQPGPPLEAHLRTPLAGACPAMETPREVLAATLCFLEEKSEVQDLENLHLLWTNGISLERGFMDAPLRNPDFCALYLAWGLRGLTIADAEADLLSFREDLIAGIVGACLLDSRTC